MTSTNADFFGHPVGLRTLFLTEMWERMSYYGMRALLVLYMTGAVTTANAGLGMSQLEAQAIYGIYVGMVYFLAVPGGWLADNLLGHQRAVFYGAIIIALGHLTLAVPIESGLFFGLGLVAIGTGLLKSNISTIVGKLYAQDDPRRDAGFTIFYMSINIGSVIGFLVCGYLGEKIGWHWGFGAAGVGMLLGVAQYARTRDWLGDAGREPNDMPQAKRSALARWATVVGVAAAVLVILFGTGVIDVKASVFAENFAYFLTTIAGLYFLYLYLNFLGYDMPVSWVQFFNPIYVVIFAPMFAGFWAWLGRRNLDPSLPLKFALGLFFMGMSFLVMLLAVGVALESAPIGLQWLLITYLLQTWGELALSPIGLSAFSRYSPKRYVGQMFGLWFLASAIGGVLAGLLGGEATDGGLSSMSPIFSYMVKYYLGIAVVLVVLAYFFRERAKEPS